VLFSENIYFINAFNDQTYLEVEQINGIYRIVLFKTKDDNPRVIAVNPIKK